MFGKRWQTGWDPVYKPGHVAKEKGDPWMMQIPCKGMVTIYPNGGSKLAVDCDYHPQIARQLASIPGVDLAQDGDQEKTFVFDVSLIDQVAAIIEPRRRRQLSEEHRARLAAAGKAALERYRRSVNLGDDTSELKALGKP
jgi:hypothetical protein